MLIRQISIFAENKKNELLDITKTLKQSGADILALSLADTADFGVLRVIVKDTDGAVKALTGEGHTVKVTDVIGVSVPHAPGGLHNALEVLSRVGLSIEYMYAFVGSSGMDASVILRVDDNNAAAGALTEAGISLLTL